MGETRISARETLKVTSAVDVKPLAIEEGIFHFPADSTSIMEGSVIHLCFASSGQRSGWEEVEGFKARQDKLGELLLRVGLGAPGRSLASLMEELKAGAPGAVGLTKEGYILRIRLYIHPRENQVGTMRADVSAGFYVLVKGELLNRSAPDAQRVPQRASSQNRSGQSSLVQV